MVQSRPEVNIIPRGWPWLFLNVFGIRKIALKDALAKRLMPATRKACLILQIT